MMFVAGEVRRLLAGLGFHSMDEAIGRVECLRQKQTGDARVDSVDVGELIAPAVDATRARRYEAGLAIQRPRSDLGDRLAADAFRPIWDGDDVDLAYEISNRDRT